MDSFVDRQSTSNGKRLATSGEVAFVRFYGEVEIADSAA
jgi:hypothetical protein